MRQTNLKISNSYIYKCGDCKFETLIPQPTKKELDLIYTDTYFPLSELDEKNNSLVSILKNQTAVRYLRRFQKYKSPTKHKMLEIGCGDGDFLCAARDYNFQISALEYSNFAKKKLQQKFNKNEILIHIGEVYDLKQTKYDYIVFFDVLEHVRDPNKFMKKIYSLLNPGGLIFLVVPNKSSITSRIMSKFWFEYKLEHISYFNSSNLSKLISDTSFLELDKFCTIKTLNLKYIFSHFEKYPVPLLSSLFKFLDKYIHDKILNIPLPFYASGIGIVAQKKIKTKDRKPTR